MTVVKIDGQEHFLSKSFVSILQRQVAELEAEIKECHRLVESVAEWYELCRYQNFSNREIMAKLFVSRRYDLASPLGFAWLAQIYLPSQEISPCPRSRAWQIKEKDARAEVSGQVAKSNCPFDYGQLCGRGRPSGYIPGDCPGRSVPCLK